MKEQWSREQAQAWYQQKGWLCGFNYLPSTAVNWTDIWQAETFDAETIERELGFELDWRESPEAHQSRIVSWRFDSPLQNAERWEEYADWMADRIVRMDAVFTRVVILMRVEPADRLPLFVMSLAIR